VIDAADLDRIFDVLAGAQVVISGLTIQDGITNDYGGGIQNSGSLEIRDCMIKANFAQLSGAGVMNHANGTLSVEDCVIQSNDSLSAGGGISAVGDIVMKGSRIQGNSSGSGNGGGMLVIGDSLIEDSTIANNRAEYGGGIYFNGSTLTLTNSIIHGNTSYQDGGGVTVNFGTFVAVNSTFSGNTANSDGGAIDVSGGLITHSIRLINSTLSGNRANDHGGAIMVTEGTLAGYNLTIVDNLANFDDNTVGSGGGIKRTGGTVSLRNSILANNIHIFDNFAEADDCNGVMGIFRYSLVNATTGCTFTNQSTLTGVNNAVLPLTNNGGATQTHALQRNSLAVDAAEPTGCTNHLSQLLALDQRGQSRHLDSDVFGSGMRQALYELSLGDLPAIGQTLTDRRTTNPCRRRNDEVFTAGWAFEFYDVHQLTYPLLLSECCEGGLLCQKETRQRTFEVRCTCATSCFINCRARLLRRKERSSQ
jgi:hypothetical protein